MVIGGTLGASDGLLKKGGLNVSETRGGGHDRENFENDEQKWIY